MVLVTAGNGLAYQKGGVVDDDHHHGDSDVPAGCHRP